MRNEYQLNGDVFISRKNLTITNPRFRMGPVCYLETDEVVIEVKYFVGDIEFYEHYTIPCGDWLYADAEAAMLALPQHEGYTEI